MHSRREQRRQEPSSNGGYQQTFPTPPPPEMMHVSMKVDIISDGPGGISFSQAVNTPAAGGAAGYGGNGGFYDYHNNHHPMMIDNYPAETSMITWPVGNQEKATEPTVAVVQFPTTTDTSQENMTDATTAAAVEATGDVIVPKVKAADNGTAGDDKEKKKHRYHRHKHHRKKDPERELDDQDGSSVARSQSATSLTATSVKLSDVTEASAPNKVRGRKYKKAEGDDNSKTSGRSSSVHGTSSHGRNRREKEVRSQRKEEKQPQDARQIIAKPYPPSSVTSASAVPSSKAPNKPVPVIIDRKLDELLSEVVINTFEDAEDTKNISCGSAPYYRRSAHHESEESHVEGIGGGGKSNPPRYPIAVDTPTVPKFTANRAVQVDDELPPLRVQTEQRAMQTDDDENRKAKEKQAARKKKSAAETKHLAVKEQSPLAPSPPDFLRQINEATSALVEASKLALETQRAISPYHLNSAEWEIQAPARPRELQILPPTGPESTTRNTSNGTTPNDSFEKRPVRRSTPKETLIDDPAIPPLSTTSGDDNVVLAGGRSPLNVSKASSSGGSGHSTGAGLHHNHDHEYQQLQQVPGTYYMHTYCAVCGSPRTTRKAISGSGGPVSPVVINQSMIGSDNDHHFLSNTSPSGGDATRMTTTPPPPRTEVPPPPPLPPPLPPPNLHLSKPEVTTHFEETSLEETSYHYKETRDSSYYDDEQSETAATAKFDVPCEEGLPADQAAASISVDDTISARQGTPPEYYHPENEASSALIADDEQQWSKTIDDEIRAEAKARLRDMQLIVEDFYNYADEQAEELIRTAAEQQQNHNETRPPPPPIHRTAKYEKIPNGDVVMRDDLKEALEHRRQQLAKQRETFFGDIGLLVKNSAESNASNTNNSIYVRPVLDVVTESEAPIASLDYDDATEEDPEEAVQANAKTTKRPTKTVRYGQSTIIEPSDDDDDESSTRYDQSISDGGSIDRLRDQQSYAEWVTEKRLMPSAKIFQLHMKPPTTSTKPVRQASQPANVRGESEIGEMEPPNTTRNPPASYAADTLTSTSSGGNSRKSDDLYRKALLRDASSKASSINSERSSISTRMIGGRNGAGAFTTEEVERYFDDNLSDYSQDRVTTPIGEDWPISRISEGTRSHDSLASETSFKADASHEFYSTSTSYQQQESKSVTLFQSRTRHQNEEEQHTQSVEKSFTDILRERNAGGNVRLLYPYSTTGNFFSSPQQQQTALDRIDEYDDPEAEAETENTLTETNSIDREGSGIYVVKPSISKIKSGVKKSPVLTSAMLGKDDAGSSSIIGSDLENIDDYSQGRISPMIEIGNDRFATISSYGEPLKDAARTAQLISRERNRELNEGEFVGYGKAKESLLASSNRQQVQQTASNSSSSSSSSGQQQRKRVRQTDL